MNVVNHSFNRILNLSEILKDKSHFLFGPRATGKSWLIKHQLPHAQVFDLLDYDTYERFLMRQNHSVQKLKII
jgi:predicted AAA+ superfamily ATPase